MRVYWVICRCFRLILSLLRITQNAGCDSLKILVWNTKQTRIQNTEIRTRYLDMSLQGSLTKQETSDMIRWLAKQNKCMGGGLFCWWCWGWVVKCKIYFEGLRKSLNSCRVVWRQGRVESWAFRYKAGPQCPTTFGQVCRICVRQDKERVLDWNRTFNKSWKEEDFRHHY